MKSVRITKILTNFATFTFLLTLCPPFIAKFGKRGREVVTTMTLVSREAWREDSIRSSRDFMKWNLIPPYNLSDNLISITSKVLMGPHLIFFSYPPDQQAANCFENLCQLNESWFKKLNIKLLNRQRQISVCNFQSMKSPVELNSLLSKFFRYITWFVISPD